MNDQVQHLLSKHGILISFNIAKKIKMSKLKYLRKKLKSKNLSEEEIQKQRNEMLLNSKENFFNVEHIPGLTYNDNYNSIGLSESEKDILLKLANYCSTYCNKNKLSKENIILFMQLFLHLSNITNQDVYLFKKKYGFLSEDDDDFDDNDDDF